MATSRLQGRRGDGSAVVRGWVAIYTLGLPAVLRERRRGEVAGDLADETLDAVRRGETTGLRRRRLERWFIGIPDDVVWRLVDAPADARALRHSVGSAPWTPVSRLALVLLAIAAIGAGGGLSIMIGTIIEGRRTADTWFGWGPYGFIVACSLVLLAVLLSVPWPRRGLAVGLVGVALGMAAAPWIAGCWLVALFALALRWYQANTAGASVP